MTGPEPRVPLLGTSLLAWRNLSHDRARFIVTLIGVGFSVLLMGVELGLLVGFARTTSGLVDHSHVDLWITPAGTTNVDIAGRLVHFDGTLGELRVDGLLGWAEEHRARW